MQAVPLAVVALSDHVEGVVVCHPPLVAGHALVCTPDIGGAAVSEGFLSLAPQNLHRLRDVALDAPGKGGVAGYIGHQIRVFLPQQQLHVLITLHHGMLGFLQVEVQESVPCLWLDGAFPFAVFAPLVYQAVQIVLLDGPPAAVQHIYRERMLRIRLGTQSDEPVIGFGFASWVLASIFLPIVHRFQPPDDFLPFLGGVMIQRLADLTIRQEASWGCGETGFQLAEILLLKIRSQRTDREHPLHRLTGVDPLDPFKRPLFSQPANVLSATPHKGSNFFCCQHGFHRCTRFLEPLSD